MRGRLLLLLAFCLAACGDDGRRIVRDVATDSPGETSTDAQQPLVDAAPADVAPPDIGEAPAVIWAHSGRELFNFNPTTRQATSVGIFDSPEDPLTPGDDGQIFFSMTDLAVRSDGAVFGLGRGAIWRIDTTDARCTRAVRDVRGNALTFVPAGVVSPQEELIVGYENDDEGALLAIVNIPGQRVENLASFGGDCRPSGDIASITGLGTFVTLECDRDTAQDFLARLNVTDASIDIIGPTGVVDIWGLGFWAGNFFGFTAGGELVSIDADTGEATLIDDETGAADGFWGAGVTPDAPLI
ncbi:MAG: hypothetical protein AAF645_19135 [Myxococcota bacterium]